MLTIIFYFLSGSLLGLTLGKHLKNQEDLSYILIRNNEIEERLKTSEKQIQILAKGLSKIEKEATESLSLIRELSLLNKYQKNIRVMEN